MTRKHVPTLDIRRYDNDRDAFVHDIGAAYCEYGFCGIGGHGISAISIGHKFSGITLA